MSNFIDNQTEDATPTEDPEFPYLPPSMHCQPIIEYSGVIIHKSDNDEINGLIEDGYHFGIAQINIRGEIPLIKKHLHIIFMIDMSCSMSEPGSEGKTKMADIISTMENLLRLLWDVREETNISVCIAAFDTEIVIVFEGHLKRMDLNAALRKVKRLKPRGSTDIGIALDFVVDKVARTRDLNPDWDIAHIFMTDGEITCGEFNRDNLLSKLVSSVTNIFIGYGKEHDAGLLSYLGKENYRFIDATEKAGLVYGEIVHSLLYKAIDNCELRCSTATIYDYATNKWKPALRIGNLLSEQRKTYHIRIKKQGNNGDNRMLDDLTEEDIKVHLYGTTIVQTHQFQQFTGLQEFQSNLRYIPAIGKRDLSVYLFRQKTQELLYEAREFTKSIDEEELVNSDQYEQRNREIDAFKAELKAFHEQMTTWAKNNGKEDDPLIKNLADDIYIANRTVGTQYGTMFACARQVSQGQQHIYSCRSVPEDEFGMTPETTIDAWDVTQDDFASPYATRTATKIMYECSQHDE
jgi:hypothetical protein